MNSCNHLPISPKPGSSQHTVCQASEGSWSERGRKDGYSLMQLPRIPQVWCHCLLVTAMDSGLSEALQINASRAGVCVRQNLAYGRQWQTPCPCPRNQSSINLLFPLTAVCPSKTLSFPTPKNDNPFHHHHHHHHAMFSFVRVWVYWLKNPKKAGDRMLSAHQRERCFTMIAIAHRQHSRLEK